MLDTIASTLSKPHSYEAIKLVIDNDEFDKCMKAMIIDRNYTVLNEVISSEPTLEDIDFVLCCMELYPINDLFQPLSEAIANLPNAQNASFSVDYQMVLDKIQENGIDANPKWLAN